MTLGIFWVGQQTQLNHFKHSDRDLAWIHIGFLARVAIMPFSTMLLAEFITDRVALIIYWANIPLLGRPATVVEDAALNRLARCHDPWRLACDGDFGEA